ncbi:MAG: hypothetical protein KJO40_06695 [Deltaproteobacteria bacterium]|nr:hypothetical protein [Deltaproteobacteria bacterium]MBT8465358.1 hypothetical protein [Deltaproteobacteria bacterium]NND29141.1 hypothetical protein [Myxococcales bacterium]NNK08452.1 hypothetical protein [Myxococcales bacterium]NNK44050.1 hypothetical protein [Myxococcales bacterium]
MTRCVQWMILISVAALGACTSGEGGPAGNTELNVIVPNGYDAGSSAPALIDIQDVEYTIDCAGNSDTFLDNNASFDDAITLNGNLEVQDGRTNAAAIYGDPSIDGQAEIWQGFMDLPPGPCTIELRARDNDGEVICTAQEPFSIAADSTSKVNIVLICDISFQAPVGMLDVDGTFSFNVGNFCPDLFILNCLDSTPTEQVVLPPPNPPLAGTGCQVRFRDGDSTCGAGCDPQTCVPNGNVGLTCTPGPDPGVSTTVSCTDAWLDCDGDGTPDPSCTFTGDTVGDLEQQPPSFPGVPGNGGFFVTCIPPALGGSSGAVAVCTAVTTDGDTDCDKVKTVEVNCVGEPPCFLYGVEEGFPGDGDATCQAATSTSCTTSVCDDTLNIGGSCSGGICCVDTPAPNGTDCSAESPPIGECQGGICVSVCCIDDAACDDGNECTTDTCDVISCLCTNDPAPNDGNACQPDLSCGSADGTCAGGTCGANDACTVPADCPSTPPPPASPQCAAQVCSADVCGATCDFDLAANVGAACDFFGPGAGGGVCTLSGQCVFAPPSCINSGFITIGCSNPVVNILSLLFYFLQVDVSPGIVAGAPFDATLSGVAQFPVTFFDIAQTVIPGGVSQVFLDDAKATVSVRSGATGPDVVLGFDEALITPGATPLCTFLPANAPCDPANDVDPGDPTAGNSDCLPIFAGNSCQERTVTDIPTSSDCCPVGGGCQCDLLGKTGPGSQCDLNGFCVTGFLDIPLETVTATYTADTSGSVLFGFWDDPATDPVQPSTLSICTGVPANDDLRCQSNGGDVPIGAYALPTAVYSAPTEPIGLRVSLNDALFVPFQCAMAEQGGACSLSTNVGCLFNTDCPPGEFCIDPGFDDNIVVPTPDSFLLSCPINF